VSGFVQKVRRTILRHQLLERREPVIVACSGGPDSVALARALGLLRHPLTLVYVDHCTRPETTSEAAFVEHLAACLHGAFVLCRITPRDNSEAALREARYAALDGLSDRPIATGHTADDQAETVLMRALRGAGLAGLSGIPPKRGRYVRPLIDVSRGDVTEFLHSVAQRYCIDPTNFSRVMLRNRIRHELLPSVELAVPGARRALVRLSDAARSDRSALEHVAATFLAENGLSLEALQTLHPGLLPHVLRRACTVSLSYERIDALRRLVERGRGRVEIEGGMSAVVTTPTTTLGSSSRELAFVHSERGRDPALREGPGESKPASTDTDPNA
jgi:tRNA(Ile)-lysidine synthetase-like protein